jgi:hypothetical protein
VVGGKDLHDGVWAAGGAERSEAREFNGNTKLNILSCYQNVIRVHENLAVELLSIFCSNAV